jgi:hypothetical protein
VDAATCHNSRSRRRSHKREHIKKNCWRLSSIHAESDLLALRDAHIEVVKYKCIVIYGCNSRAPHGTQYANESHGKFCLYTSAAITTSVINIFSPQQFCAWSFSHRREQFTTPGAASTHTLLQFLNAFEIIMRRCYYFCVPQEGLKVLES